ncbi:hypothetical protein WR25_05858 isoform N [Diploscapter pachys]|uniref:Maelstrom domain-containing protein n=1 Tax=Diploscapter pachys TaxID=2018661 RepID=A0A2A2L774_9BILA|nr:hypothetical protein WR25_05858 isoform N [Diploscapter pachys]
MPISMKKSVRKANGYGLWLMRRGRNIFYAKFKIRYEEDLWEHQKKLSKIWHEEVSEEEKEKWRAEARRLNESGEFKAEAIKRDERRRGELATKSIEEILAAKKKHEERVAQAKQMTNAPSISYVRKLQYHSRAMSDEDYQIIRKKHREGVLYDRINFARKMYKNPANPGRYGKTMFMMTVFPYIEFRFEHSICVHPAEISVARFSIDDGIVDSRTWNIHFDPAKFFNELYQGTVPDYAVDSLENNVSCLNRSMDEIEHLEGGTTIGETWLQMKEFLGESPFILIDANQNNLIVRFKFTSNKLMTFCLLQRPSLHFCALHSYSTTDARHFDEEAYFDREVAPKLFAIQDYVEVINSFDGKIEGGEVTTKFIEERFQRPGQPTRQEHHCRMHQREETSQDMTGRLHCTLAHAARLLDAFYDLMRTFEVYSDQPEYFRKESQYLDVAAIAPGLYNMNAFTLSKDQVPVPEKMADEAYKLVEHQMRALAKDEVAKLGPRLMAALKTNKKDDDEEQRGSCSRTYHLDIQDGRPRRSQCVSSTTSAESESGSGSPVFLPTSLQKLFKWDLE